MTTNILNTPGNLLPISSNNLDAPNKRPLSNQEPVERELKLNPKSRTEVNGVEPTYMALLSCDISGDVVYLRDLFFSSLRPYRYIEGALEITFNSGIILNIADVLFSPKIIPTDTEKLLFNGVLKPPFISLTRSRIPWQDKWFLVA
ncbi:hypothetical protein V2W45_1473473 [Cenococcum geophilum]